MNHRHSLQDGGDESHNNGNQYDTSPGSETQSVGLLQGIYDIDIFEQIDWSQIASGTDTTTTSRTNKNASAINGMMVAIKPTISPTNSTKSTLTIIIRNTLLTLRNNKGFSIPNVTPSKRSSPFIVSTDQCVDQRGQHDSSQQI